MADSTLTAIRTKVRRLTRTPSASQMPNATLDEYINTFIQYDFPSHVRLFKLHQTFTWYTLPNVEEYNASNLFAGFAGLTDFEQSNLSINPPIFIAGRDVYYTQSRTEFYNYFSQVNSVLSTGLTGDGIITGFSGTLSQLPILRNNVHFVSINTLGNGLRLSDDGAGNLTGDGIGTINYITGAYTLNFTSAPGAGESIDSETVPYVAGTPTGVLYYGGTFIVRPVPDRVYPVQMEVYVRPTELLDTASEPELEQWWQYIAYGAAKKIFEDRMDLDSVNLIMPEFKKQEQLVLRRTIVQQTNERVSTIYTDQTSGMYGPGWYNGGGNF